MNNEEEKKTFLRNFKGREKNISHHSKKTMKPDRTESRKSMATLSRFGHGTTIDEEPIKILEDNLSNNCQIKE